MRAYPWGSLPRVARAEALAARAMRRWGAGRARLDAIAGALSSLVGAHVAVEVTRVRAVARATGADGGVAVIVAGAEAPELARGALLEADGALAASMVARAIRRPAPSVPDGGHAPGAAVAGSLAALVIAAARRVHAHSAPRVLAAGPAAALARDFAGAVPEGCFEATLTVTIDDDAYVARVTIPRALAQGAPEPPWTDDALASMGEVPLAVPIVATASGATASLVGSLRKGDAWLPGEWPLRATPAGGLAGLVWLAPAASERALRAELGEDGRLVLRGGVESLAWTPREDDVSEEKDALVEAVGEVPVVVRVEVGVAEMRAREWAALGRGDVIALGRKVGEAVTLRVGGVAVARGELVDLEGEIGVRILGRTEER